MEAQAHRRVFRFGVFEADVEAGELRKRGVRIRVPLQAFQVLQLLIENAGRVVSRDELRHRLWSADTFVEFDRGLNNAISRVREVLDDSASSPRFIETIPKKGYRFIGSVESIRPVADVQEVPSVPMVPTVSEVPEVSEARPGSRLGMPGTSIRYAALTAGFVLLIAAMAVWGPQASKPRSTIRSIAVLPLKYASAPDHAGQDYLADGMTDALITELAKLGELRVISETSSSRYKGTTKTVKQIAKELDVDALVEGSVHREGAAIRVTIQLIHAGTDSHVWGESFTRGLGSVLALQGDLATAVAREIGRQLSPPETAKKEVAEKTIDPEAYRLYVIGQQLRKRETEPELLAALDHFQRALKIQPDFGRAYLGIAESWISLSGWAAYLPAREGFPKAKSAATKALELDDSLPEAYSALAHIAEAYDWNLPEAERLYRRSLALGPNDALTHARYSNHLARRRLPKEALEHAQRSYELDPISIESNINYGLRLFPGGKRAEGLAALERAVNMNPSHFHGYVHLGEMLVRISGREEEALAATRRAVELAPSSAHAVHMFAHVHGRVGKTKEAEAIIRPLEERPSGRNAYDIGMFHLSIKNYDKALRWLTKSCDERTLQMGYFHISQVGQHFNPIRNDQRFKALVQCGRD